MRRARWLSLFVVVLWLPVTAVTADEFHLKNGSILEGTLVRETETHYHFRVVGIGEQRISRDRVRRTLVNVIWTR